jgi:hypothetical protein
MYEGQYEAFAKWFKDNHPEQRDRDDKPIAWELRHVTQEHADRYPRPPLLRRISRPTVDGCRPTNSAISTFDLPA